MMLSWQWPWAALAGVLIAAAIILLFVAFSRRVKPADEAVFSLDDDLNTEHASRLFRQWRALGRLAVALLVIALVLAIALVARPSQVDSSDERASSRDIVLCLDVSGSTLPYDREVIDTYLELVKHFEGERIGMSIFNSTSRTVFPLTDDYELVTEQLTAASKALKGVQTQDDIDKMSDAQYQKSRTGWKARRTVRTPPRLSAMAWSPARPCCPASPMVPPMKRTPSANARLPSCWPPTISSPGRKRIPSPRRWT